MAEEKEDGISLGDIFKILWKRKILIAVITGVILILFMVLILFVYNPSKTVYTATVEFSFSGSENGKYPSGKAFIYKNIVSKENLEKVIASDEKYASFDAEDLYKKDKINISLLASDTTAEKNTYTIVVKNVGRKDESLVADFVEALMNQAYAEVIADISDIDYVSTVEKYQDYQVYETAIAFLQRQKTFLEDSYTSLISDYSSTYTVNGKNLQQYKDEIDIYFSTVSLDLLLVEAETNHYILDSDAYLPYVKNEILRLQKTINENEMVIDSLHSELNILIGMYTYGNGFTSGELFAGFNDRIAELVEENTRLSQQLHILEELRDSAVVNPTFENTLQTVYRQIREFVLQLEENVQDIDVDNIRLIYGTNAIVETSGGFSIIVSLVLGLAAGLIIACACGLITEYFADKKKLNKEDSAEEIQEV